MKQKVFNEVVEWVEAHLATNPSIDDVARAVGYSRRYVYNIFYEFAGLPVGKYIRMRRMTLAAGKLKLTQQPISSIACQLHFDSHQTFSREFKKVFGRCPGQYRDSTFWDMSVLQQKAPLQHFEFPVPYLCVLKEQTFIGYGFNYTLSLSDDIPSRKNVTRAKITAGMISEEHDIYVLSDFSPAENNIYKMMVNGFIGMPESSSNNFCQSKRVTKSGLYLALEFSGTWEDFTLLSNNVYMKHIPALGLYRREGYDIEHFVSYKNADVGDASPVYNVRYFVPVNYIQ